MPSLIQELLERQDNRCLRTLRRTVRRLPRQCVEDFYSDVYTLLLSNGETNAYYKLIHLCKSSIHQAFNKGPMNSDLEVKFKEIPLDTIEDRKMVETCYIDFCSILNPNQIKVLDLLLEGNTQAEICCALNITQHTFLKIRTSMVELWNEENRNT